MNNLLLEKARIHFCSASFPVKNLCAKFKIDRTKRFGTGAHQILTTQNPFPDEIPQTFLLK